MFEFEIPSMKEWTAHLERQHAERREREKANKALVDQFYRELDEALDPRRQWVEKPLATVPYRDWHSVADEGVHGTDGGCCMGDSGEFNGWANVPSAPSLHPVPGPYATETVGWGEELTKPEPGEIGN